MKIFEIKDRTTEVIKELLEVWEDSVKATHLFLSSDDIKDIKEYVPEALKCVSHLVIIENESYQPIAFMGIDNTKLEMLFIKNSERGKGLGKKLLGFLFGAMVLGITCYIDDVKGISPLVKLAGQLIAAIIVVSCGVRIDNFTIPFKENSIMINEVISYILTIGWIVGITNAINLIDGLDGLSSGITLIACISMLIIFSLNESPLIAIILITALAGAIVGFLPYNFNPAKTFIGDVGSNFMGYAISIISILGVAKTYTAIVIIAPIIVLALPIFDTLWAIVRRIVKTKSIKGVFKADKGHLHHRLMAKGYTQRQAVLILYGVTATLGMIAIILLDSGIWKAASFALLVIAIVAIGYRDFVKLSVFKEAEIKKENKNKEGEEK